MHARKAGLGIRGHDSCWLAGNIIHGDLTHGNILLASSTDDPRGFTAKVI